MSHPGSRVQDVACRFQSLKPLGRCFVYLQAGWGDLKVVNFHEEAELLHRWPPPHFDVQVTDTLAPAGKTQPGNCFGCMSNITSGVQVTWKKVKEGRKWGRAYEVLQGELRPVFPASLHIQWSLHSSFTPYSYLTINHPLRNNAGDKTSLTGTKEQNSIPTCVWDMQDALPGETL